MFGVRYLRPWIQIPTKIGRNKVLTSVYNSAKYGLKWLDISKVTFNLDNSPRERRKNFPPTLSWIGIVEEDTGDNFLDPGDLPLVDPVTLHLFPSKSVVKLNSYGAKSEIRCQIFDKVQDKRDTGAKLSNYFKQLSGSGAGTG